MNKYKAGIVVHEAKIAEDELCDEIDRKNGQRSLIEALGMYRVRRITHPKSREKWAGVKNAGTAGYTGGG